MLLQGIVLGLSLSFMIGPLLFAILQAGIERGFRAGLAVAGGIWLSDVLYVVALRFGMDGLTALTAMPGFRLWAGIAGGLVLAGFGLGNHPVTGKPDPSRPGRELSCTSCHNPHSSNLVSLFASESLSLRSLCLMCHKKIMVR